MTQNELHALLNRMAAGVSVFNPVELDAVLIDAMQALRDMNRRIELLEARNQAATDLNLRAGKAIGIIIKEVEEFHKGLKTSLDTTHERR